MEKRRYLTQTEVVSLISTNFTTSQLEQVRDMLIFSCFTSLSLYSIQNLHKENIEDGQNINLIRGKTGIPLRIPLLPISKRILEKYIGHKKGKGLFPKLSNRQIYLSLKKIECICGITKGLTFRTTRNTFAAIAVRYNIPAATISKIMGLSYIGIDKRILPANDETTDKDFALFAEKSEELNSLYH